LAIVVLLLWFATAAAGLTLLRAGGAARRAAVSRPAAAPAPARIGAVPLTADGKPPPTPHTRVTTPAGDHPLLEFSHPALAITGIACWLMFTLVHYRPLAWIAFGILVLTMLMGATWLASSRRSARRQESPAWSFPPRLAWLHGLAAVCSITVTVLVAVTASRA
jgi:membrane glycosyltransferase